MATFSITIVNRHFTASNNYELDSVGDARKEAIKGALQIGVDEVSNGKPFFGAEVKIEQHEEVVSRFVVSIGASPLQ